MFGGDSLSPELIVALELSCLVGQIVVAVPLSVNYICLIFMPSEAESALLDASICLHALALWGVVRSVMLVLADVRVCEWRCGCLCLLAQCFCIERLAYNPNHSSSMPLCLRCLFVVPVWLTYKMVHKWLVGLLPSQTLEWCCGGFRMCTYGGLY